MISVISTEACTVDLDSLLVEPPEPLMSFRCSPASLNRMLFRADTRTTVQGLGHGSIFLIELPYHIPQMYHKTILVITSRPVDCLPPTS